MILEKKLMNIGVMIQSVNLAITFEVAKAPLAAFADFLEDLETCEQYILISRKKTYIPGKVNAPNKPSNNSDAIGLRSEALITGTLLLPCILRSKILSIVAAA